MSPVAWSPSRPCRADRRRSATGARAARLASTSAAGRCPARSPGAVAGSVAWSSSGRSPRRAGGSSRSLCAAVVFLRRRLLSRASSSPWPSSRSPWWQRSSGRLGRRRLLRGAPSSRSPSSRSPSSPSPSSRSPSSRSPSSRSPSWPAYLLRGGLGGRGLRRRRLLASVRPRRVDPERPLAWSSATGAAARGAVVTAPAPRHGPGERLRAVPTAPAARRHRRRWRAAWLAGRRSPCVDGGRARVRAASRSATRATSAFFSADSTSPWTRRQQVGAVRLGRLEELVGQGRGLDRRRVTSSAPGSASRPCAASIALALVISPKPLASCT